MKVMLIYPPVKNMIKTNVPSFVDRSTGVYPPLGLLYIASYLRSVSAHEIKVIDCEAEGLDYAALEEKVKEFSPDLAGIQTYTFTLLAALNVAAIVKKVRPAAHVSMGGPHPTLFPQETVARPEIDSVVKGEGEYTFAELASALEGQESLGGIKGLVYKENGIIRENAVRPFLSNEELDRMPHPAREMTDVGKYYSLLSRRNPISTMITSRGCPFKCIFCDRPQMGKVFRYRSAGSVVSEMEICLSLGIGEIFIYDDTFTVRKDRVLQICELMIEKGLHQKLIWDVRSRLDTIDEEMIAAMKKAGCARIHYGIEAGTEKILTVLRKNVTLEEGLRVFHLTAKYGIQTLAYFILGNPGETRDDIEKTITYAKMLRPDYVQFSLMVPYPGTELYNKALAKGIYKLDLWKKFAENPTIDFSPPLWEENLQRDELLLLLKKAYKGFYLRPNYFIPQLCKMSNWQEFSRKATAGIRLIKS